MEVFRGSDLAANASPAQDDRRHRVATGQAELRRAPTTSAPSASTLRRFSSVLTILWKSSTSARAWQRFFCHGSNSWSTHRTGSAPSPPMSLGSRLRRSSVLALCRALRFSSRRRPCRSSRRASPARPAPPRSTPRCPPAASAAPDSAPSPWNRGPEFSTPLPISVRTRPAWPGARSPRGPVGFAPDQSGGSPSIGRGVAGAQRADDQAVDLFGVLQHDQLRRCCTLSEADAQLFAGRHARWPAAGA